MKKVFACIFLLLLTITTMAQQYHSDDLKTVAEFGHYQPIGLSVSSENRVFVSFPHNEGKPYEYGLTEVIDGKKHPFPNKKWNRTEGDETGHFVHVQDLYVDAKDMLWVLDSKPSSGGSIFGENEGKAQEGKFKLLKIDLSTNKVERVYTFNNLDKAASGLNDIRVDTDKNLGYLSDPGQRALVVLDLKTGKTRTVLRNVKATKADPEVILTYQGKEMRGKNGKPFRSNVNGIALTKDNKYLYFKPINQLHLSRIETKFLADPTISEAELESEIEDMGEVGITHGLAADSSGNIFLTTSTDYAIKYLSPDGNLHLLVQDSRIIWPDSLGVGSDGYLYFTCAQLQRQPEWNDGDSKVELPYRAYKVHLPD